VTGRELSMSKVRLATLHSRKGVFSLKSSVFGATFQVVSLDFDKISSVVPL
jgi:hypothetical protein